MMHAGKEPTATPPRVYYTPYGIPIRNVWYMLLYGWKDLNALKYSTLVEIEAAPSLDALLAAVLMTFAKQRLRIGLGRSYMDEQSSLRGIRGRIDFPKSLKLRTFERGQAFCHFQDYSANAPKNQIIRSTLARLVQIGDFGPDHVLADKVRGDLRWLVRTLDGIDLIELKPDIIRRQQLGRNDADYRLMLAICELILKRQMPTHSTGAHRLPSFDRDALEFPSIYERFVANFYDLHLKGWKVMPQKMMSWHESHPNPFLPSLRPDLILEEDPTGRRIVLDTKFTAQSLIEGQWGKQAFRPPHLYQIYAYLRTQEHLSDKHAQATGILLYPAVHRELAEKFTLQSHAIRVETVDLTAPWHEIEQRLLGLILDDDDTER